MDDTIFFYKQLDK